MTPPTQQEQLEEVTDYMISAKSSVSTLKWILIFTMPVTMGLATFFYNNLNTKVEKVGDSLSRIESSITQISLGRESDKSKIEFIERDLTRHGLRSNP